MATRRKATNQWMALGYQRIWSSSVYECYILNGYPQESRVGLACFTTDLTTQDSAFFIFFAFIWFTCQATEYVNFKQRLLKPTFVSLNIYKSLGP